MDLEPFDILITRSYAHSQEEQDNSPDWAKLRALYKKNYIQGASHQRIPKKIHQIWLGSELPEKYKRLTDTWRQFHPEWEYRLWTDKDVDSITLEKRNIFNACNNNGMKSDILRYEILRQQGGIYIDTDFECLKPFDDLIYLDFFTGIAYDSNVILYNGLIATVPHHPVIEMCASSLNTSYRGNDAMGIIEATGPYYFTRCFLSSVTKDTDGVVAFPMGFFYPLPNNITWDVDIKDYLCTYSYAIHHWGVSWMKIKKQ